MTRLRSKHLIYIKTLKYSINRKLNITSIAAGELLPSTKEILFQHHYFRHRKYYGKIYSNKKKL